MEMTYWSLQRTERTHVSFLCFFCLYTVLGDPARCIMQPGRMERFNIGSGHILVWLEVGNGNRQHFMRVTGQYRFLGAILGLQTSLCLTQFSYTFSGHERKNSAGYQSSDDKIIKVFRYRLSYSFAAFFFLNTLRGACSQSCSRLV